MIVDKVADRHFVEVIQTLPTSLRLSGGKVCKVRKHKVFIRFGVHAAEAGIKPPKGFDPPNYPEK